MQSRTEAGPVGEDVSEGRRGFASLSEERMKRTSLSEEPLFLTFHSVSEAATRTLLSAVDTPSDRLPSSVSFPPFDKSSEASEAQTPFGDSADAGHGVQEASQLRGNHLRALIAETLNIQEMLETLGAPSLETAEVEETADKRSSLAMDSKNPHTNLRWEVPTSEAPHRGVEHSGKTNIDCRDAPAKQETDVHTARHTGLHAEAVPAAGSKGTTGDRGERTTGDSGQGLSQETGKEAGLRQGECEARRLLQGEILCDLFLNALVFCREEAFSVAATSTFLGILKKILREAMLSKLTPIESFRSFKHLLLKYSIQRPPISIKVFNVRWLHAAMTYTVQTFYRHYQLYVHCFTTNTYVVFRQECVLRPAESLTQHETGTLSDDAAETPEQEKTRGDENCKESPHARPQMHRESSWTRLLWGKETGDMKEPTVLESKAEAKKRRNVSPARPLVLPRNIKLFTYSYPYRDVRRQCKSEKETSIQIQ